MQVGFIGDIHGRSHWKDIIKSSPEVEHWVFIGDYVDSFFVPDIVILHNLNEIIQTKLANPEKITLLWGNHDVMYAIPEVAGKCAGYRMNMYVALSELFRSHLSLFQYAWQRGNVLATHAGVTSEWIDSHASVFKKFGLMDDMSNIAEVINNIGETSQEKILHDICPSRTNFPTADAGGPLWVDESKLDNNLPYQLKQVGGHTGVDEITVSLGALDMDMLNKHGVHFNIDVLNRLDREGPVVVLELNDRLFSPVDTCGWKSEWNEYFLILDIK